MSGKHTERGTSLDKDFLSKRNIVELGAHTVLCPPKPREEDAYLRELEALLKKLHVPPEIAQHGKDLLLKEPVEVAKMRLLAEPASEQELMERITREGFEPAGLKELLAYVTWRGIDHLGTQLYAPGPISETDQRSVMMYKRVDGTWVLVLVPPGNHALLKLLSYDRKGDPASVGYLVCRRVP